MEFNVLPLFSFPLAVFTVEENFFNLKSSLKEMNFEKSGSDLSHNFYHTDTGKLLENFPEEKNIIMKYFCQYKDQVLGLETTDFQITTSWITKTEDKGYSHSHCHTNSAFSGIFYFDSCEGGEIEFKNPFPSTFEFESNNESNIFNSNSFIFEPEKNKLIIFPSCLYHKVHKNTSGKSRYSLAFNLFPTGIFGSADSSINLKVLELDNF